MAVGAVRLVADDAGAWSLAPVTRPTHYIGRVGALAVALGVGGVIAGMPAVAMADTGTSDTAATSDSVRGHASRAAGHTATRPPTTRLSAGAHRRTSTTLSNAVQINSDPATPIRRNRIQRSVDVVRIGDALTAPTDISPESEHDTTTAEPAVAEAPVIRSAAPPGELSGTDGAPTNLLSNGIDPATPLVTPLESMAVAATRRGRAAAQVADGALAPMALSSAEPSSWPDITSLLNDVVNGVVSIAAELVVDALNLVQAPFVSLLSGVVEYIGGPEAGSIANIVATSTFAVFNTVVLYNFGLASLAPLTPVVENFASNTSVLQFISDAVAGSLPNLPDDVSATVGNAAAYLVQQSFGNPTVAEALAPVFASVTLPIGVTGTINFLYNLVVSDFSLGQALIGMIGLPARNAMSSFFADPDVQQAIGTAAAGAIGVLTGEVTPSWVIPGASPALPAYLGEQLGGAVAAALFGPNNPAGAGVSTAVDDAVVELLSAIDGNLADAVGSAVLTILSQPGVNTILATMALNVPVTLLGGTPLPVTGSIEDAVGATVTGAVNSLLGNTDLMSALGGTLTTVLTALAEDPAAQTLITDRITGIVTTALGGTPAATAIGTAAGDAIATLLADPIVTGTLGALPGSVLTEFVGRPGVVTALAGIAGQLTTDVLGGTPSPEALRTTLQSLAANPAIQSALGATVTSTLNTLLGNNTLVSAIFGDSITPLVGDQVTVAEAVSALLVNNDLLSALGGALSGLLTTITDHPIVQAFVIDQVTQLATEALGDNPAATQIASAAGNAVRNLLTNSAVTGGVGPLIGSTLVGFVGQPGVVTVIADTAGQLVTDILGGTPAQTAVQTALQTLRTNTEIGEAVNTTVTGAVGSLLGNTGLVSTVGDTASTVLTTLVGNPTVQNLIADQVASAVTTGLGTNPAATAIGTAAGDAVREFLADPAVATALGAVTGSVITTVINHPGVATALADTAGQLVTDIIGGTTSEDALNTATEALQSNLTLRNALGVTTIRSVTSLLGNEAVRDGAGRAAEIMVTALLSTSPVNIKLLNTIVGRVTHVAVSSLLGNPVVGDLIAAAAIKTLDGIPSTDITDSLIQSVLRDSAVQYALGSALGQGVGSLFGTNLIGDVVGQVVGTAATIFIGLAARIALLINAGGPAIGAQAAAVGLPTGSHFFEQVTVSGDIYVLNAIVPDWPNALAS